MFDANVRARITKIANSIGVEPAALLAVAEVESAGTAMWNVNGQARPPIRFEGHYFHQRLEGEQLHQAVAQGLANPKMGAVANPNSYAGRYALLGRARGINDKAALESTSWGLGQVMGSHWRKLGYGSVLQLVKEAESGVDGQVALMVRYIERFGLLNVLKSKDWVNFAHGYNGPAHAKNNYAGKMKAAYNRYKNNTVRPVANEVVKLWQQDLKTLGYYKGVIDGVVGTKSIEAVRAFQHGQGLVNDGLVGPMVLGAIERELKVRKLKQAETAERVGGGIGGPGGVGSIILDQTKELQMIAPYSDVIKYVLLAMVVIGVALVGYGIYSRRLNQKE